MTNDSIREFCMSLPMATEEVQWEEHLLFKIGGKMFAIITIGGNRCAFKSTPERYAELIEMADIVPSGYNMWKYQWVNTESLTALSDAEFRDDLRTSYDLVRASLTKKAQAELDAGKQPKVKKFVPKAKRTAKKKAPAKKAAKKNSAKRARA